MPYDDDDDVMVSGPVYYGAPVSLSVSVLSAVTATTDIRRYYGYRYGGWRRRW